MVLHLDLFVDRGTRDLGNGLLRVTDWAGSKKSKKNLKFCLKNALRELSSKILLRFSKNLTSSRNSQKKKQQQQQRNTPFDLVKYAKKIVKIDKVLGISH